MKRSILFIIFIVIVDQLLSWWAHVAFQNNEVYQYGQDIILRVGRVDHGRPLSEFLPAHLVIISLMFVVAFMWRVGIPDSSYYQRMVLPIAGYSAATITQTIDMLTRGYGVNYFGLQLFDWDLLWMSKLTDWTAYGSIPAIIGLILWGLGVYFNQLYRQSQVNKLWPKNL